MTKSSGFSVGTAFAAVGHTSTVVYYLASRTDYTDGCVEVWGIEATLDTFPTRREARVEAALVFRTANGVEPSFSKVT